MIDYLYSSAKGLSVTELLSNPLLEFNSNVNLTTGELSPNSYRRKMRFKPYVLKEAEYKYFTISVANDTYISLQGSPHQSCEDGHNFSDFTFFQLFGVIKDLEVTFCINPYNNILHNVEFSVNIKPHLNSSQILDAIICLRGKEGIRNNYKGTGDMIKFEYRQFEIKIYDKAMQKGLDGQLLRFEIKVTRMEFLQKKGINIHSTANLLDPTVQKQLGAVLLQYLEKITFYDDSIDLNTVPLNDTALLQEGNNPRYWKDLKKSQPETFKKRIKQFDNLVCKYGKNHIKYTLYHLISDKWNYLTRIERLERNEVKAFLAQQFSTRLIETEKPNTKIDHSLISQYRYSREKVQGQGDGVNC